MHRLSTREFSIDKKRRDPTTIAESHLFYVLYRATPIYPHTYPRFSSSRTTIRAGYDGCVHNLIPFELRIVDIVTSSLLSVHHRDVLHDRHNRKSTLLYFHNSIKKRKNKLELSKYDNDLSNLDNKINDVLLMCCHLGTMWKRAGLLTVLKLQNLLFPDGIYWDKVIDGYLTITENAELAVIRKITESYKREKEENPFGNSSLVNSCA